MKNFVGVKSTKLFVTLKRTRTKTRIIICLTDQGLVSVYFVGQFKLTLYVFAMIVEKEVSL